MSDSARTYIVIDLKSFYASVECMQRGLNPLSTNLLVADESRTDKTICLAVSPSLKSFGIPGRPRLFEAKQKIRDANFARRRFAPRHVFSTESYDINELNSRPDLSIGFIIAPPQMARYLEVSTQIYQTYLKYISPDDIHVYSIDEVFIDATDYLALYGITAHDFAMRLIRDVLKTTGVTATAGIGPNMYLAKIAMDIHAKHSPADSDGVRIAELTEMSYRKLLWSHQPISDFWRVGKGYANKLAANGILTMGDVARCSLGQPHESKNEALLYRLFGINAELLIDHAWGYEPTTISEIKKYKPAANSLGSGQVLQCPYNAQKARLVVKEMTDLLVLDLVRKGLVTDQIVLTVGYDIENLTDPKRAEHYNGPISTDAYGRQIPGHAHGTGNIGRYTSSTKLIMQTVTELFDRIVNPNLLVRRLNIAACHTIPESDIPPEPAADQFDLFTDYAAVEKEKEEEARAREKEKKVQKAIIALRERFGKNAVLKGMNLEEGATTLLRNEQIGGHKA